MTTPIASNPPHPVHQSQSLPWISWGAVIAGVATAIAVQIGLTELAIGVGLSLYEPADPESSASSIATGTIIAWVAAGMISVFLGGWVAGRMKRHGTKTEAGVHGGLVWAAGSILGALVATISVGMLASGAVSMLGQGLSAAARTAGSVVQGAASAAPGAANLVAPSWDNVRQQVQGSFDRNASGTRPAGGDAAGAPAGAANAPAAENRFQEQSRLMQLLGSAFTMDRHSTMPAPEQQELTTLLGSQLGISTEAARQTLDQWQRVWRQGVERYETAKEEAKRQALAAATVAKKRTAQAALIAFATMILSLAAAVAGALVGSASVWSRARAEAGVGDNLGRPAFT
jgi:hypothetical protein